MIAMQNGLSVILPAYGYSDLLCDRLPSLQKALGPFFPAVELIVVDDGSYFHVGDLRKATPDVRIFRNRQNLGKGASILLGLHAARHSKVLVTDADIPFDLESYERLAGKLAAGAGAVIGSRRRPESEMVVRFEALPHVARRHFVGVQFNRMVRLLTGLPYTDTQCGLKGFDRELALSLFQHVREPRFLFDVEVLLAARFAGVDVLEVPVSVIYEDSRSTIRVSIDAWQMGRDLVRVWWRLRRGGYRLDGANPLLDRVWDLTQEVGPGAPLAPGSSPRDG